MASNIQDLPDDALISVLRLCVRSLKDFTTLSRVSKRFRAVLVRDELSQQLLLHALGYVPFKDTSRTYNTLYGLYLSPENAFTAQVEHHTLAPPPVCEQLGALFALLVNAPAFPNAVAELSPSPRFFRQFFVLLESVDYALAALLSCAGYELPKLVSQGVTALQGFRPHSTATMQLYTCMLLRDDTRSFVQSQLQAGIFDSPHWTACLEQLTAAVEAGEEDINHLSFHQAQVWQSRNKQILVPLLRTACNTVFGDPAQMPSWMRIFMMHVYELAVVTTRGLPRSAATPLSWLCELYVNRCMCDGLTSIRWADTNNIGDPFTSTPEQLEHAELRCRVARRLVNLLGSFLFHTAFPRSQLHATNPAEPLSVEAQERMKDFLQAARSTDDRRVRSAPSSVTTMDFISALGSTVTFLLQHERNLCKELRQSRLDPLAEALEEWSRSSFSALIASKLTEEHRRTVSLRVNVGDVVFASNTPTLPPVTVELRVWHGKKKLCQRTRRDSNPTADGAEPGRAGLRRPRATRLSGSGIPSLSSLIAAPAAAAAAAAALATSPPSGPSSPPSSPPPTRVSSPPLGSSAGLSGLGLGSSSGTTTSATATAPAMATAPLPMASGARSPPLSPLGGGSTSPPPLPMHSPDSGTTSPRSEGPTSPPRTFSPPSSRRSGGAATVTRVTTLDGFGSDGDGDEPAVSPSSSSSSSATATASAAAASSRPTAAPVAAPAERQWWAILVDGCDDDAKLELGPPKTANNHELRVVISVLLGQQLMGECTLTYQSLVAVMLQELFAGACALEQPPIQLDAVMRARTPLVRKLRLSFRIDGTSFVCTFT